MQEERRRSQFNAYNASVLDLHLAAARIQKVWRHRQTAELKVRPPSPPPAAGAESLASLLMSMTTELTALRGQYSELEAKNRRLLHEMEALQHEKLDLRTHSTSEEKRLNEEIRSLRQLIHTHLDSMTDAAKELQPRPATPVDNEPVKPNDNVDVKFWHESLAKANLQEKQAKKRVQGLETQLAELQALYSMQRDECRALRSEATQARLAVVECEERNTALEEKAQALQSQVDTVEGQLRRCQQEVQSQYHRWMQSQTELHDTQAERDAIQREVALLRSTNEQLRKDNEQVVQTQDEITALKRLINGLKGTVTAKTAEAKAFQAYGASAREHLHAQGLVIQQHSAFRSKCIKVRDTALVSLRGLKRLAGDAKEILVAWQSEMLHCLSLLQTKLAKANEFVHLAAEEHKFLRHEMLVAQASTAHLHEELWKLRQNALIVGQAISSGQDDVHLKQVVANFDSGSVDMCRLVDSDVLVGDLIVKSNDSTELPLRMHFDVLFSNRGREWTNAESVTPTIQSVLDGHNACVVAFEDQPLVELGDHRQSVTSVVLEELFGQCTVDYSTLECSLSYLGVYSELVFDLLSVDPTELQPDTFMLSTANQNPIVVLDIRSAHDAAIAVEEGGRNFDRLVKKIPTMHRLTHCILTVCITIHHAFHDQPTKSKLQIVQLASGDPSRECTWQETERIRATISAENSLNAFTTCIADVRQQDPTFVRYHSSKLTLLLQDCLDQHAKLLVVGTLRTDDNDPRHARRLISILQLFLDALKAPQNNDDNDGGVVELNHSRRFPQTAWRPPRATSQTLTLMEAEVDAMKERQSIAMDKQKALMPELQPPSMSETTPSPTFDDNEALTKFCPPRKAKRKPKVTKRLPFR
ncbi:unnamed protein product [Aphanomyces euteiches]|uniref:Kinesin motor domain-containing protein n=2 Tax=Aphanomyces euteiches TaxID=100861 RepID=A0A6G0XBP8_9STRA|nr:hypothetical protein Ae201684_006698 [Aphanomyces euteiches]KAH9141075.1 hypothetical protein AeRB84_014705 [Aphanomyces euteiches]